MEMLYQEVRLVSTSRIMALWVLPANIDAKHFPNTFLNLDSGNSQQFVNQLSSLSSMAHTGLQEGLSAQDRDLCRSKQGGHKLTYRESQRRQHKDAS